MLDEVINKNIAAYIRQNVATAIPAEVVRVNEDQTVDAKPLISRVLSDGGVINPSIVSNAPIVFPSAGGGVLSFPIEAGDTILLIYSMRSIDEWLDGEGQGVVPLDSRHYHLTDAIAIPGLYTKKTHLSPSSVDTELKFNSLSIRLEAGGDIVLSNPSYSLTLKASGDVLHSSGAKISAAGDFITAAGISLDNHVHAQGIDSDGNSQVPTDPPTI